MDRLTLVPQNITDHEILPLLREICQDNLQKECYPRDIAENYQKYDVKLEFKPLQATGVTTIKIYKDNEKHLEYISKVEEELITNHAHAIIKKYQILPNLHEFKFKRQSLFEKLSTFATETYNLIQKSDLLPNFLEQHLNFIYNPFLHTCTQPCPKNPPKTKPLPRKPPILINKTDSPPTKSLFRAEPPEIAFINYELEKTYTEKFKFRNISATPQYFTFNELPKSSHFSLKMLTDSCRLASGMYAEFLVIFKPKNYQNCSELIIFKTSNGLYINVLISNYRESPKLTCYVYNPLIPLNSIKKPKPGSKYFSKKRQSALNFTIDCGSCLMGNFQLVSMVMKNIGQKGRFLITTEAEWVFNDINESTTRLLELTQGAFTIFPTFFEIEPEEIGQLFVLFSPEKFGVFTEKLYMLCDNNTHQELELLGDCLPYNDNFLKVKMYLSDQSFHYKNRSLSFISEPNRTSNIIFSVINKSSINFPYYWALKTYKDETNFKKMNPDWIKILYGTNFLPSFSITDVVAQITPETQEEGQYYILLSLYLKNIPLEGFTENIEQDELTDSVDFTEKSSRTCFQCSDIHIFELAILCKIKIPKQTPKEEVGVIVTLVKSIPEEHQSIRFSKTVINFGVIPKGIEIFENVFVQNLTDQKIEWKLMEIYQDSSDFLISVINTCRPSEGILKPKAKKKITYTVRAKEYTRRIHYLILFSCPVCTCQKFLMEDLCWIIYEIEEIQISIRSENNTNILCPREFLYVGIPSYHKIYIHNSGAVAGCFYFLKPQGENCEKLALQFVPQSGVVFPNSTIESTIEIQALDIGIFEDIIVPCFVGNQDKLIYLKISCTVASINLYFYLPNKDQTYQKYLWPPKSDTPYWDFEITHEDYWTQINNKGESIPPISNISVNTIERSLANLVAPDSIIPTYPTIKTQIINVKKPCKVSFYFENLTPVHGHFLVNPTNYGSEESYQQHILVKSKIRTPEFFWEKACLDGYGIVVEAEPVTGDIISYEVIQIDLWIYAITWGKYLEEIIVEVDDLTPFCFNLLIEVQGLPLEFPFARNTILPLPTIRFENVAFSSENVTKNFTVTNISSVPIEITWNIFTPTNLYPKNDGFNVILDFDDDRLPQLTLTKSFQGFESCWKCVHVNPREITIDKQSTASVSLSVTSTGFVSNYGKINLKYKLIGLIKLQKSDRFKENYFKRNSGTDISPAKIEILVTMEQPILQIDVTSDDTNLDVFVNDILLRNYKFPKIYFILRNVEKSDIYFRLEIDKPFEIVKIRTIPGGMTDKNNIMLKKNECLQVLITCFFTHEELLEFGNFIYENKNSGNYTSTINKDLNIYQAGVSKQMVPFQVRLHYPQIDVKPTVIKFGETLIFNSRTAILTIYNMTASVVKFEIYKSTQNDDFAVNPSFGEIPGTTGVNKQFIDVNVYFSPKHCKSYWESLRVNTNIPKYFIDVQLFGSGTNNEKFSVN